MLYKIEPIDLDGIHFGAKFDLLHFFSPDNRADIGFGKTNNTVRDTFPGSEHLKLLTVNFADHFAARVIFSRHFNLSGKLPLQLIEQTVELVQKQQQATGTFDPFLTKLFPFALVIKVFLFLVQIFAPGYPDLAMLAHQNHLVVHPMDTFPQ